jgi:hypothetical protein
MFGTIGAAGTATSYDTRLHVFTAAEGFLVPYIRTVQEGGAATRVHTRVSDNCE